MVGKRGSVAVPHAVAQSPAAARVAQPQWRDGRLIAGVVLVLVSVLLGARIVGGASNERSVVATARSLPAGHVLGPDDLTVRSIRLSEVTDRYWTARDIAGLTGHPLLTSVGTGELLARSAVAESANPTPTRVVSVPVDPTRVPLLHSGNRVDVFATFAAVGATPARTDVLIQGAEYLGGSDSNAGTTVAVRLRIPVGKAADLVKGSQTAKLDIVLQEPAGDNAGDVTSGAPAVSPAPGVK